MPLTSGNVLEDVPPGRVSGAARRRSAAQASGRHFVSRCVIAAGRGRRPLPPLFASLPAGRWSPWHTQNLLFGCWPLGGARGAMQMAAGLPGYQPGERVDRRANPAALAAAHMLPGRATLSE